MQKLDLPTPHPILDIGWTKWGSHLSHESVPLPSNAPWLLRMATYFYFTLLSPTKWPLQHLHSGGKRISFSLSLFFLDKSSSRTVEVCHKGSHADFEDDKSRSPFIPGRRFEQETHLWGVSADLLWLVGVSLWPELGSSPYLCSSCQSEFHCDWIPDTASLSRMQFQSWLYHRPENKTKH